MPSTTRKKRIRELPKCRGNYVHYNSIPSFSWLQIFQLIEDGENGSMKTIARENGVNYNTLKHKYRDWRNDGSPEEFVGDNRGKKNKVLSDEEEAELAEKIRNDYIDKHIPLVDEDISCIALAYYNERHPESYITFTASHSFVTRFKKKFRFSSRKPGKPHSSSSNKMMQNLSKFKSILDGAFRRIEPILIINVDETSFRISPEVLTMWSYTGTPEQPFIHKKGDEKKCFTAICGITASGEKLPLMITKKGKTERCLRSNVQK